MKHNENPMQLGLKSPALKCSNTLRIYMSVFSLMFILGCASIPIRPEQTPTPIQPSPELATLHPTLASIPETQDSECTRLNLTSQECASLGKHWFTLSGVVDGSCWYGTSDRTVTRDLLMTVSFSSDDSGTMLVIGNGAFIDCPMSSRSAQNIYTYDCIGDDLNYHTGTITFVDNGFLNEGGFTNSANKNCNWSETYKLLR